MDGSIGAALTSHVDLAVRGMRAGAGVKTATGATPADDFAAQLQASFAARATQLGLTLPATVEGGVAADAGVETSDAAWKRAEMQALADGHGPGDAMLKTLAEASQQRAERERHGKGRGGGAGGYFA
ncbi:MAG: hypothetical protein JWO69_286 [Thermoleophilia bacterium]|jgi:hypothetical protein|nr:hypothetical protein [Thermoleophilia bacterium]